MEQKEVYDLFKQLNFKRYIERFNLAQNSGDTEGNENGLETKMDLKSLYEIEECEDIKKLVEKIRKEKKVFLGTDSKTPMFWGRSEKTLW